MSCDATYLIFCESYSVCIDRVFGSAQGAFAERVAANWKQLYHIPSNMVRFRYISEEVILLTIALEHGSGSWINGHLAHEL